MADRYYSVALGGDIPQDVTEGAAATPAAFVDVRLTYDATGASKLETVKALNAVIGYILQDNFPPV